MGVYIKGMEMPKYCDVCAFSDWSNLHQTACCKIREYNPCFEDFSKEYVSKRPDWCPLVEVKFPHGDLIDRDQLALPPEDIGSKFAVEYAPAVIEAEGGD